MKFKQFLEAKMVNRNLHSLPTSFLVAFLNKQERKEFILKIAQDCLFYTDSPLAHQVVNEMKKGTLQALTSLDIEPRPISERNANNAIFYAAKTFLNPNSDYNINETLFWAKETLKRDFTKELLNLVSHEIILSKDEKILPHVKDQIVKFMEVGMEPSIILDFLEDHGISFPERLSEVVNNKEKFYHILRYLLNID